MNFREALNHIYKNRERDEDITNPFLLYSRLSDLCSSSYVDKEKVQLFHQINSRLNIVQAVLANTEISSRYDEVSVFVSQDSFDALVLTVKKVLDPSYEPKEQAINKSPGRKKAVAVAVVEPAQEREEQETHTPLNPTSYTNNYSSGVDTEMIIGLSVVGGILLAIGLLITFACVFAWPWTFWQWFIGIVGGIVAYLIIALILFGIGDTDTIFGIVGGIIIFLALIVVNFILLVCLGANYKIIFGCLSVLNIISAIVVAYISFDEVEEGAGGISVVEGIVALVLMIVGLVWL